MTQQLVECINQCGWFTTQECGYCQNCQRTGRVPVVPAACQEPQPDDGWIYTKDYDGNTIRYRYISEPILFNLPKDNTVPASAQAILNIKPDPKPQPVQPVDMRAAGMARAINNLSSHEPRLGASRYQP
jgi:hypothetical protein